MKYRSNSYSFDLIPTLFILAILILFRFELSAQTEISTSCHAAGFESGSLTGHNLYIGSVAGDGTIVFQESDSNSGQHSIVHIGEGVDAIASANCEVNKDLPVVPSGAGVYAIRIGDDQDGKKAAKLVIRFEVTPAQTFFLLKYAILMEDPGHLYHQQPRFELNIRDELGEVFSCGHYLVHAGRDLEGFENCTGSWRVRSWTSAGIELQSYLGQFIEIELVVSDCSLGVHKAFGYFDASCRPLEITLDGYCPGSTEARMQVTDGFDKYLWNTGDTTSVINISDPVPGTEYFVTVTSATGCTLVLSDTIPELVEQTQPSFDIQPHLSLCPSTPIWLRPTGKGLHDVLCAELGYAADSFLIVPEMSSVYTFIGWDKYKCKSDTTQIEVIVTKPDFQVWTDSVKCYGGSDGHIEISSSSHLNIHWSSGDSGPTLHGLSAGSYSVTISDPGRCSVVQTFYVGEPDPIKLEGKITSVSCRGATDGAISILTSKEGPFKYEWSHTLANTPSVRQLSSGSYFVTVTDIGSGCSVVETIHLEEPYRAIGSIRSNAVTCFGNSDGSIEIELQGTHPHKIMLDEKPQASLDIISELPAGIYKVSAEDAKGCRDSSMITVTQPEKLHLQLEASGVSCFGGSDGSINANASGGTPPYTYIWDGREDQTNKIVKSLYSGVYHVSVVDANGCLMFDSVNVDEPTPIRLKIFTEDVQCFGRQDGYASFNVSGGTPGYSFYIPGLTSTDSPEVSNLAAGEYEISVSDAKGCIREESFIITEPRPLMTFVKDRVLPNCDEGLPGMTVVGAQGGTPYYYFNWSTGSRSDTIWSFDPSLVLLTVTDQNGCSKDTLIELTNFDIEITANGLTFDSDSTSQFLCLGDSLYITITSPNQISSVWWSGAKDLFCQNCIDTRVVLTKNSILEVEATSDQGCLARESLPVVVNRQCVAEVFIPNAITPANGDGINDSFYVVGARNGLRVGSFRVFNRWGGLVYSRPSGIIGDETSGWSGIINGKPAPPGVYLYAVEIYFVGRANPLLFSGEFHLVR